MFFAVALGMGSALILPAAAEDSPNTAETSVAIPWSQLGAKAGADYKGDGLAVIPTAEGARLRCVFQRLEGEATREGLWLTSTVTNAVNDRFRLVAAEVGRATPCAPSALGGAANRTTNIQLSAIGNVSIDGQIVRFTRPRLVEEYTVSMDGVRQDFVVLERPAGAGELALRLAVSGAKIEPAVVGARLVLESSGRKIAYSRLRVTDATGKELAARMEVLSVGDEVTILRSLRGKNDKEINLTSAPTNSETPDPVLAVLVNDACAEYPVRIDPTFSDANWTSMNPSIPGANGEVSAAVVDGSGNLYIGGEFTIVGDVFANNIAKWNGSSWSALGSGMDGSVQALAVSGSDLYAGGDFLTVGGKVSGYIARASLVTLPALSVLRAGTHVMVSWPSVDTAGFALEQAASLATQAGWVTNTVTVTDDGTKKSVTLTTMSGPQFFRLHRP